MWEKLNQNLAEFVLNYILADKRNDVSEEHIDVLRYGLLSILSEGEKILLLFIIFLVMHSLIAFVGSFFILISIRIFAGGSHRNTMTGCFLQSLITMGAIIFLSNQINTMPWAFCVVSVGLGIVILKKAPIVSGKRGGYSENRKIVFRKRALFFVILWTVIGVVTDNIWSSRILCCLLVQLIDMCIMLGCVCHDS